MRPSNGRAEPLEQQLAGAACHGTTTMDRPAKTWIEISVPAIVAEEAWQRVQQVARQQAFTARNSKSAVPAARYWRLLGMRIRLLPHLHQDQNKTSTTTGASGLTTTASARPGLPQPAGPRRYLGLPSYGSTSPACSPDPALIQSEDRQAPGEPPAPPTPSPANASAWTRPRRPPRRSPP